MCSLHTGDQWRGAYRGRGQKKICPLHSLGAELLKLTFSKHFSHFLLRSHSAHCTGDMGSVQMGFRGGAGEGPGRGRAKKFFFNSISAPISIFLALSLVFNFCKINSVSITFEAKVRRGSQLNICISIQTILFFFSRLKINNL